MPSLRYRLRLKLWLYPGKAAWTFATLPKREGREIRDLLGAAARGWGSLPVRATLGATTWDTSIFPDAKTGSYLLPVKAAVRRAEGVAAGTRSTSSWSSRTHRGKATLRPRGRFRPAGWRKAAQRDANNTDLSPAALDVRMAGDAGLDGLGRFVGRRELALLRRRLEGDERVLGAVDGRRGRRRGLLAATDRRIAWVAKGVLRRTVVSWPYEGVGKVEVRVGRDGAVIDLLLEGDSETFTHAERAQARAFAEAVKRASPRRAFRKVTAVADPAAATPLEELLEEPYRSRLARLERMHQRGTVTEPEYQASRKGILEEAGV